MATSPGNSPLHLERILAQTRAAVIQQRTYARLEDLERLAANTLPRIRPAPSVKPPCQAQPSLPS